MACLSSPPSSSTPSPSVNQDSSFCVSGSSQSSVAAHDPIQETRDGGKNSFKPCGSTIIVDGASGSRLLGLDNPIPPARYQRYVKVLTRSDVNSCCRLMFNKSFVTKYFIPLMWIKHRGQVYSDAGYNARVLDVDTRSDHVVNFKYWESSKSYVFTDWSRPFVKRRSLRVGDTISLSWDGSKFYFSVSRRARQQHQ